MPELREHLEYSLRLPDGSVLDHLGDFPRVADHPGHHAIVDHQARLTRRAQELGVPDYRVEVVARKVTTVIADWEPLPDNSTRRDDSEYDEPPF